MRTVTINKKSKLYVLQSGNGYSCLGFDVCLNRATKLNTEIKAGLTLANRGTLKLYKQYLQLIDIVKTMNQKTGFRSTSELIPEFIGKEGKRVEVITAYDTKERYYIGKSNGFIPCHLEIKRSDSHGGAAVMGYPFKSIKFLS